MARPSRASGFSAIKATGRDYTFCLLASSMQGTRLVSEEFPAGRVGHEGGKVSIVTLTSVTPGSWSSEFVTKKRKYKHIGVFH